MLVFSIEYIYIQENKKCRFNLKCVRDMIIIYSQIPRTGKCSKPSSIIWSVRSKVLVYELSGSGLESRCSHFNFKYCACFNKGVPRHSVKYRVWIHAEMRT